MADASKLKAKRPGRGNLGSPPGPDEVATSLNAPEIAPAPIEPVSSPVPATSTEPTETPYVRRDGRSARKTHRTLAFATRVTPEFDNEIRDIAEREGLKLVEVLENAVAAYKKQQGY
ncbi:hypothetical protein MUA04_02395 [Enterobacteriaceae bacterium H11S18]|uniref:hypothetical protein n=1 Tax=Dryocola clanedunensis TaxID=2925396 RepID=UPI0022F095E4|nr:hypothetical protein [Dryocola clanedunensis]MCT4709064.1 hypothetical protein [Dryocola clanedunensis]